MSHLQSTWVFVLNSSKQTTCRYGLFHLRLRIHSVSSCCLKPMDLLKSPAKRSAHQDEGRKGHKQAGQKCEQSYQDRSAASAQGSSLSPEGHAVPGRFESIRDSRVKGEDSGHRGRLVGLSGDRALAQGRGGVPGRPWRQHSGSPLLARTSPKCITETVTLGGDPHS